MADPKKFLSTTGSPVTIIPDGSVTVPAEGGYETDDESLIEVFENSPEIVEVKGSKPVGENIPEDAPRPAGLDEETERERERERKGKR